MISVAVEVSLAESKPPVANGERISKGERHDLGAAAPLSTGASFLEQGSARGPVHSSPKEAGRTNRAGINPVCRTPIPMHRLNCCSGALRTLASLGVCLPVCLHGKTWLPSVVLQAGLTLTYYSRHLREFVQIFTC